MAKESAHHIPFLVCRACADYGCGFSSIQVKREENTISWNIDALCSGTEIEDENFQYDYTFDLEEYQKELANLEAYYRQLIAQKNSLLSLSPALF